MNIEYLPIYGYENLYEVSNTGEVKSLARVIELSTGGTRLIKERILRQKVVGGYMVVTLCNGNIRVQKYVHRLVAESFIPRIEGKTYVNHKDGCKGNNYLDNLEWVDHSENVRHGYEVGLNTNKGRSHVFSVGVIDNELGAEFGTIREWCKARNINYSTGRNILNGYTQSKTIDLTAIVLNKRKTDEK